MYVLPYLSIENFSFSTIVLEVKLDLHMCCYDVPQHILKLDECLEYKDLLGELLTRLWL